MTAEELMAHDPVLVGRRTTLRAAARLMRDHDTGVLPVIDDHGLVGVLTDRDVVVRAVAQGVGPLTGYVEDSMSPDVLTCTARDSAESVVTRMARAARLSIVVLDDQELPVGVIGVEDLVRHEETASLANDVLRGFVRARDVDGDATNEPD